MLAKIKLEILKFVLKSMAKVILWRKNPYVIGITGSVGKTTTKEAIYYLVKNKYKARESKKNYNNEIGVPLTIIGAKGGASSFSDLFSVFKIWLKTLSGKVEYPKMLVLEMAIDKKKDMEYLLSIVKVDIAVITFIANSHAEFFENIDEIAKEKGLIVENLKENSKFNLVFLNEDDVRVKKMENKTKGKVITYGFSDNADFYASDILHIFENNKFQGLSFKLNYEGKTIPIRLNYVLADYYIYNILVALAVAINLKMNVIDLAEQITSFRPPIGRMNLIDGINSSTIIDDTYNASPKSAESAIKTFAKIPSQRKMAVLGDMLELGKSSKHDHEKIVNCLVENKIDLIFLVGKRMREVGEEILQKNNELKIKFFDSPIIAGEELSKIIEKGDLILVKGSRGMRMEKVIEKIMTEKENMENLLCCQDKKWKKKEYKMP